MHMKCMRIVKMLKPGQKGAKAWMRRFGPSILCVRYRRDEDRREHVKTVEWVVQRRSREGEAECSRARMPAVGAPDAQRCGDKHESLADIVVMNRGFNETVNRWHIDHDCKHSTKAMLTFWLMAMIAFNFFYTFYHRNLKPALQAKASRQHIARCLASELYVRKTWPQSQPP